MSVRAHCKAMLKATFLGSSAACAPCAGIVSASLMRPEGERHYLLASPSRPSTARRPLVIVLHGGGASARQVFGLAFPSSPLSLWLEIAEREQLLVMAADAGKGGWSDCFASDARVARKNDVAFIAALIDHAIARHGADPERVYLIGVSRGGMMAYRAAAEIPHKLAAFSALLAGMPPRGRCVLPATPLSALILGGTADPFIPYHGGKYFRTLGFARANAGIEESAAMWRTLAGLPDTPLVAEIPSRDARGRTRATQFIWGEAADRVQVALLRIEHGGHAEPSGAKRYPGLVNKLSGPQNGDLEVAELAWEFFRHKRRAPAARKRLAERTASTPAGARPMAAGMARCADPTS